MYLYKSEFIPDFIYKKIVERLLPFWNLLTGTPAFYRFHKVFLLPCLRFKNKSLIYIRTTKFSHQDLTPTLLVPFLHIPNIIIIQINIIPLLSCFRGVLLQQQNKVEAAIESYQAAIKFRPKLVCK